MRILLAVDGSSSSNAAVETLLRGAWPTNVEVLVVSVAEPVYPPGEALPAAASTRYAPVMAVLTEQAEKRVQDVAARLQSHGFRTQTKVLFGEPGREIVDAAREHRTDLILLGTHGRRGLRRLVMGSVAEYVVRHAPCSVEVAKLPQEAEPSSPDAS